MWSHLRYSSSVSNPSFAEVGLYPHKHKKKKVCTDTVEVRSYRRVRSRMQLCRPHYL